MNINDLRKEIESGNDSLDEINENKGFDDIKAISKLLATKSVPGYLTYKGYNYELDDSEGIDVSDTKNTKGAIRYSVVQPKYSPNDIEKHMAFSDHYSKHGYLVFPYTRKGLSFKLGSPKQGMQLSHLFR